MGLKLDWASEGEEVSQGTILIDHGYLNFVGLVPQRGFWSACYIGLLFVPIMQLEWETFGVLHKNPSGLVLKSFDWNKNTFELFGPISNQYDFIDLVPIHAFIALFFFSFFERTQITSLLKVKFHFFKDKMSIKCVFKSMWALQIQKT